YPASLVCLLYDQGKILRQKSPAESRGNFLFLRPGSNKCFTKLVTLVLLEVLNKSCSQIFCFSFPFRSICISITRIQDCRIYTRKLCRNFKIKVWDLLRRSI